MRILLIFTIGIYSHSIALSNRMDLVEESNLPFVLYSCCDGRIRFLQMHFQRN